MLIMTKEKREGIFECAEFKSLFSAQISTSLCFGHRNVSSKELFAICLVMVLSAILYGGESQACQTQSFSGILDRVRS